MHKCYVLKRTVEYFTERGSHVFTCFMDFSKAFDKVNYWKLFNKLLDDRIDVNIVAFYCSGTVNKKFVCDGRAQFLAVLKSEMVHDKAVFYRHCYLLDISVSC